jgi:hypothetical protein
VDESGKVYVADTRNNRIQVFAPNYPAPDPIHGLVQNGSFEETPDLKHWVYGGKQPVVLTNTPFHGTRSAQLGHAGPVTPTQSTLARIHQTIHVRPEWERPMLTFHYRVYTGEQIAHADFRVWLSRTDGSRLATVLRDGFRSCHYPSQDPPSSYDLGWRSASYDLSALKGQNVRLVFETHALHDKRPLELWALVDDVRVLDAGPRPVDDRPRPEPVRRYIPAMMTGSCDPVGF